MANLPDLAYKHIADLLNNIEEGAAWPARMATGRAAFMQKEEGNNDDDAQHFDDDGPDTEAEHHLSHAAQVLVTANAHGGDVVWTRPRSFRVNAVQHEVKTSKCVTATMAWPEPR